jgi:hypothetical protein
MLTFFVVTVNHHRDAEERLWVPSERTFVFSPGAYIIPAMSQAAPSTSLPSDRVTWKRHGLALGLIAVAVALAYLPPLLQGRVYYSPDTSDINYVLLRSHVEDLRHHGLVAWCPGLGTGHDRPADPTTGVYSPRVLIFLLIPNYHAQNVSIILYAIWAGLGAYLLGLGLTGEFAGGLFLGLCWPLAGVMIGMTVNIPYFCAGAWLPWTLAAWLQPSALGARLARTGWCAAMIGVEGDLPGVGVTLGALGLLAIMAPVSRSLRRELMTWAGTAVAGVGLTAAVWLPALAILPETPRAGGLDLAEATAFSLHPASLAMLLAPRWWGLTLEGSFWGNRLSTALVGAGFWFETIYLGLLAPPLIIVALLRPHPRRRLALGLLTLAVLLTVLALGRHVPVLPWLMEHVPALRGFRYPSKFFTWSALFMLAGAGLGLRESSTLLQTASRPRAAILGAFLLYLVMLVAMLSVAAGSVDAIKSFSLRPELSLLRVKQDLLRLALFTAGAPILVYVFSQKQNPATGWATLLTAITALDLLCALPAKPLNPGYDFFRPSALAEQMRQKGDGRLLVDDQIYFRLRVGPRAALKPNWAILDGGEYALGKTAILPRLLYDLNDQAVFAGQAPGLLRVLAVRYLLSPAESPPEWTTSLRDQALIRPLVSNPEQDLTLWETSADFPRLALTRSVRLVGAREDGLKSALEFHDPDPGHPLVLLSTDAMLSRGRVVRPAALPAAILKSMEGDPRLNGRVAAAERPDGDRERIVVELDAPGLLVAREYLLAGWRVEVDGKEEEIFYADGVGRGVFVAAGKHDVVFRFEAREMKRGLAISLVALVLLVPLYFSARIRSRFWPGTPSAVD